MGWTLASTSLTDELRDAQQLDGITELLGERDIKRRNVGNPLGVHLFHIDRCPIGQRHQDRQLVGRIDTLHVECRIRFGITSPLRFIEYPLKTLAFMGHARENIIGRPVDDPINRLDGVGRQPLPQRLDDGNPSTHTRFETEVDARAGSRGEIFLLRVTRAKPYWRSRHVSLPQWIQE